MAANDWLLQMLADVIQVPIERPAYLETTVLGAAFMAGLGAGLYASVEDLMPLRTVDRVFEPNAGQDMIHTLKERWQRAVQSVQVMSDSSSGS